MPKEQGFKTEPHHWYEDDRDIYYSCASLVKWDQIKNKYISKILSILELYAPGNVDMLPLTENSLSHAGPAPLLQAPASKISFFTFSFLIH